MIIEDYVSFEIAKLLKKKGFDEPCGKAYNYERHLCNGFTYGPYAPTLQKAMKWLREVHKLCIIITPQVTDDDGDGGCLWKWTIEYLLVTQSFSLELFASYEEACEAAIKYCLENLI